MLARTREKVYTSRISRVQFYPRPLAFAKIVQSRDTGETMFAHRFPIFISGDGRLRRQPFIDDRVERGDLVFQDVEQRVRLPAFEELLSVPEGAQVLVYLALERKGISAKPGAHEFNAFRNTRRVERSESDFRVLSGHPDLVQAALTPCRTDDIHPATSRADPGLQCCLQGLEMVVQKRVVRVEPETVQALNL